jgi:hypothetical protein
MKSFIHIIIPTMFISNPTCNNNCPIFMFGRMGVDNVDHDRCQSTASSSVTLFGALILSEKKEEKKIITKKFPGRTTPLGCFLFSR